MTALTAQRVSRRLHVLGFTVLASGTARSREGIRVRRHPLPGHVSVTVDLDGPSAERRLAEAVAEALTADGYAVETAHADYPGIMTVTERTAP